MKNYTAIIKQQPNELLTNGIFLYGFKAESQEKADLFLDYKFDINRVISMEAKQGVFGYNEIDGVYLLPNQEIYN